jgi:hypothetical protein
MSGIPADIEAIWGDDPVTIAILGSWGDEKFRASELHSLMLLEAGRDSKLAPLRAAFIKAHAKSKPPDDNVNPDPEEQR